MTNISYWERDLYTPWYTIIGAGFLGLWTALELSKLHPTRTIVILERDPIPYGASIRNAGFLSLGSIGEFLEDEDEYGLESTIKAMKMRLDGINKVKNIFATTDIGLKNTGSLDHTFLHHSKHIGAINNYLSDLVFSWATNEIIYNNFDCTIETDKLYNALVKLLPNTVKILSGMNIHGVESTSRGTETKITTISNRSETIVSKKIIACMNGFTSTLFPDTTIQPVRNQIIVVRTKSSIPDIPTYAYGGHVYSRKLADDLLLVGGARNLAPSVEATSEFGDNTYIRKFLKRYAAKRLFVNPNQLEVVHEWSGIMGFNPDKLNSIQQHSDGIFSACCCNGMGVAMSSMWAETVAKKVE